MKRTFATVAVLAAALFAPALKAQEPVVNVYSTRHYPTDTRLYENFTAATGIKVNLIEGQEDPLIERIRAEGENSPADVLITVDAGRLWRAEQMGLFAPIRSELLEARIPAYFRHPEGKWFGFSYRARVIVYNKAAVSRDEIKGYADLADPKWKGRVCVRSSGNVYNLSLLAALIEHWGEEKARAWAQGVKNNLARPPQGSDTDQIKAVAAGECDVALVNHYYYVRLLASDKPADLDVVRKVALAWPDQDGNGTHVNISGAGMVGTAPHKEAAIRFLEYLASEEAQVYFAVGNNEWPTVPDVAYRNRVLASLGEFKIDPLPVEVLGKNQPLAQRIFDEVGWR